MKHSCGQCGRQGKFINEYADYIQQLHQGQAGKLRIGENEKHATVRRRLVSAAQALGINLIIKRSGSDIYFWSEERGEEQPRRKRSYTRRGSPGGPIPGPNQSFIEPEAVDQAETEESPELGQLASEAERHVAQG
jgi:hypothetical protein